MGLVYCAKLVHFQDTCMLINVAHPYIIDYTALGYGQNAHCVWSVRVIESMVSIFRSQNTTSDYSLAATIVSECKA